MSDFDSITTSLQLLTSVLYITVTTESKNSYNLFLFLVRCRRDLDARNSIQLFCNINLRGRLGEFQRHKPVYPLTPTSLSISF